MPNDLRNTLNTTKTDSIFRDFISKKQPLARSSAPATTWTLSGVALASCLSVPSPANDPTPSGFNCYIYGCNPGGSGGRPLFGLPVDRAEASAGSFDQAGGYRIEKADLVLFIEDLTDRQDALVNTTEREGIEIVYIPSNAEVAFGGTPATIGLTYYRIDAPAGLSIEQGDLTFKPSEALRGEYTIPVEITVTFGQESYDGTFIFTGIANDDPHDTLTHTVNSVIDTDTTTADVLDINDGTYANGLLLATLVASGDPDGGESGGLVVNRVLVGGTQTNHATHDTNDFEIRGNQLWLKAGEQLIDTVAANNDIDIEVAITTNGAGNTTAHRDIVELEVV
jgi:hypothetical protein